MEDETAKSLIKKYSEGLCTPEEKELVESWYLKAVSETQNEFEVSDYDATKQDIWKRISAERPVKVKKRSLVPAIAAAAILILTVGLVLFVQYNPEKNIQADGVFIASSIQPGGNKAVLTLADGTKISLTDIENGKLAEQLGVKIIKTSDGQLIYEAGTAAAVTNKQKSAYNVIETPVGGQYQIKLNDGTNVWLNAGSKLKYPVHFDGGERKVQFEGEGYFEVSHDKSKPFKVVSAEQTVVVLGTRFNVNTYQDEPDVNTTLLEGSVSVTNTRNVTRLLKPGQQASLRGSDIKISEVDVEQALAWHNGDFAFEGAALKTIMRQISRWYDVEVIYQGKIAEVEFGGSISRSKNIREVLKVLEMTQGVHFRLEGRRLVVMP